MKFFIKKPFEYKGKLYSRRDRYIEMPYEDAKKLKLILLRKVMKSGDNKPISKQSKEVKKDEESIKNDSPGTGKSVRTAGSRRRSNRPQKQI